MQAELMLHHPWPVTPTRTGVCEVQEVQDFPDGWKSGNYWTPSKSGLAWCKYGKQFLSEALDFDKIFVCFSLFIISRFRALWPITYYA